MAEDPNMLDWLPGQPPPWLDAYGQPPGTQPLGVEATQYPVGALVAGVVNAPPPAPPPEPAPPPAPAPGPTTGKTSMGPRGRNSIGPALGGGQVLDEIPQPQFAPPWLVPPEAQPVQGQPAPAQPEADQLAPQQPITDAVTQALAYRDQLPKTVLDPNAPIAARQKAWASLAPEDRTRLVTSADPNQLAAIVTADMDPADLAQIAVRHQQAQMHLQSAQQLELARKADQDARANFQTYQQAVQQANAQTAQLATDAQQLAQQKIDPNEHGVGHFLASVFTAALGGAVSQYTGGRNLALEELDKQTQRRIDAQQQNIQNGMQALGFKRNLIAEQLQRSGDLYHASEVYRISQYDRATAELQTRMQDYDPQGTTALRAAGVLQQLQAQRAAALQAYNNQQVELGLKRAQTAKTLAETFKTATETDKLKASMSGGAAAPQVLPPEYFTSLGLVKPPQAMSIDAYKEWLALGKAGAESTKAQQETAANAAATTVSRPHGDFAPITDKNGNPIRIAADVAKELNDQNASAQNVVSGLNDVKRMLEEDPSLVDRKTWAELQARIGQSMAAMTGYFKARFSSREEEAIKDITNLDFDSYTRRLKDKGTAVASINGIIDTIKQSVDTTNSNTLHTPVSGMLSDVGIAPKPKPTEVDELIAKLSTPNPNTADPTKLIELYTTPEERQKMPAGPLLGLAQGRAAQNPAPGNADRAALLARVQVFANSTIQQHSGRWYLVDADGNDIKGVPPADTQAGGEALLAKYRDVARAGLAKLSGDAESGTVREGAGQSTLGGQLDEALGGEEP